VALSAALVLALAAGACGEKQEPGASPDDADEDVNFTEESSPEVTPGGSVTYGLGAETDGWNPTINRWSTSGHQVSMAVYDHLAEMGDDGLPHPYLAESIEHNDEYTQWTITLREGVTFHDGSALTATDLQVNMMAHQASPLSGKALKPVTDMAVDADDLTLTLDMDVPWIAFPYFLTGQVGVVVEPGALGWDPDALAPGGTVTANQQPVGTGPFVFDNWEIDRQLVVKKNDDYWRDGLPHLDEVVFQPVVDAQNRVNSLTSGDLGVVQMTVSASGISALREIACTEEPCDDGTVKYYDNQGNAEGEEGMLMVQALRPPFDDPVARRAVASGINRDDLLETVFAGIYEPALGPFAPDSKWYEDVSDQVPPSTPTRRCAWPPSTRRRTASRSSSSSRSRSGSPRSRTRRRWSRSSSAPSASRSTSGPTR
jgi:ABC-type transport system substrate-binding protein